MKIRFLLIVVIFSFCYGCSKKNTIEGVVEISGKVVDVVSNLSIQKSIIQLVGTEEIKTELGIYNDRESFIEIDTADASGNYHLSYNATGRFYKLKVIAVPSSRLYVSSDYTDGQNNVVNKSGNYSIALACYRSAFAKVNLINTPPTDTIYSLSVQSVVDDISLRNFYKDTVVYLKLIAKPNYTNEVRIAKTGFGNQSQRVLTKPWDTTSLRFEY